MLMELLGPKVCTRCVCVIICVAVILLSVFGAPFITSVFSVVEPFLGACGSDFSGLLSVVCVVRVVWVWNSTQSIKSI